MLNIDPDTVAVAVGVLIENNRVLVSRRPVGTHLAHFWEFPGGKIEPREKAESALIREFKEELDIQVFDLLPLLEITHCYPGKRVCLKVFRIGRFEGSVRGKEGQKVLWCDAGQLDLLQFPPANKGILDFVRQEIQSA